MSGSYLSTDFLAAHGVTLTPALRSWVTRAAFLAKTRSSAQEKQRYEMWALHVIEEAMRADGGVAGVEWNKRSPVMPHDAPQYTPAMLADQQHHQQPGPSTRGPSGLATPQLALQASGLGVRDTLLQETMTRAPAELRAFVLQAFALYDKDVACGRRRYDAVTFLEMLNIAKNLHRLAEKQQQLRGAAAFSAPQSSPPHVAMPQRVASLRGDAVAEVAHQPSILGPVPRTAVVPAVAATPPVTTAPVTARKRPRAGIFVVPPLAASADECDFLARLASSMTGAIAGTKSSTIVGRSQELERLYSRYEPSLDDIRPLPVLERAFAHVRRRAARRAREEGRAAGLKYLSEQLKGMRQDLRVQDIVNDFAVEVYECHARLALETRELGEFNQCQAALKQFYQRDTVDPARCHAAEFFYYRIVYLWLNQQHDALSTELIGFTNAHLRRNVGHRASARTASKAMVQRALRLCEACAEGDCAALARSLLFFQPGMRLLVGIYLQRLRVRWLHELLCALKGNVSLRFLMACLGFTPLRVARPQGTVEELQDDVDGSVMVPKAGGSDATRPTAERKARAASAERQGVAKASNKPPVTAPLPIGGQEVRAGEAWVGQGYFWLDGSREAASREFAALFALLKIALPSCFSFDGELARDMARPHSITGVATVALPSVRTTSDAAVASVDAATALKCVAEYVAYLGTRKDAAVA